MKEIDFAKKCAKKRVILVRFNDDDMTDEFSFDYQNADIIDWRVSRQKTRHEMRWGCYGAVSQLCETSERKD